MGPWGRRFVNWSGAFGNKSALLVIVFFIVPGFSVYVRHIYEQNIALHCIFSFKQTIVSTGVWENILSAVVFCVSIRLNGTVPVETKLRSVCTLYNGLVGLKWHQRCHLPPSLGNVYEQNVELNFNLCSEAQGSNFYAWREHKLKSRDKPLNTDFFQLALLSLAYYELSFGTDLA